tara:strand:+ start:304 stop:1188 length:885 start_codon:yes stop_codon:yes gene_type:complete
MPYLVNVKNETGIQSTVDLFQAFNALTNNTEQYYVTTTAGGATTTTLDWSSVLDVNGVFTKNVKFKFWRNVLAIPFTQVELGIGTNFSSVQDSFNSNTNLNSSTNAITNEGAQIIVIAITDDYSQVSITINNPPSATYDFYKIQCTHTAPTTIFAEEFLSVYNTTAPPVGAGISIEDNAYGSGSVNYREFLREISVSPILFSTITATFSNKSDAFRNFIMFQSSITNQGSSTFLMQRSPYMNANTYRSPIHFSIDGFFGLQFQISPYAEINLKFWAIKQQKNTHSLDGGMEATL